MAEAGRPTLYDPAFCEIVATMALNGATDAEIAEEIGVSVMSLWRWRGKYPEFRDALRYGKDHADERVERSLYQRAVGFAHDAVKISFDKDGTPLYAAYTEYLPPDPAAAKLWLTNRQPEKWRDKIQQEHTGPDGGAIQIVSTIPRPKAE